MAPVRPGARPTSGSGIHSSKAEREKKISDATASNESFGGWTKTLTGPRLCAAIVDRLTLNGTMIETGIGSYRLASTRARAAEPAEAG